MDIENILAQILNSTSKVHESIQESLRNFANLQSRISKAEEAIDNLKISISELKNTNQRQNDEIKTFNDIKQQLAIIQKDVDAIKGRQANTSSKVWDFTKIVIQQIIWAIIYGGIVYLVITLTGKMP